MQKNYRLIISIITLGFSSICAFAQDSIVAQNTIEYKDVFLDGKPAKLNVATGEVKLVQPKDKVETVVKESVVNAADSSNNNQTENSVSNTVKESDFYIVKEGESLFDVSKKYNVSLSELKAANNLETTLINVGQKLRVVNFDAVEAITYTSNSSSENANSDYYIVERGNTLFSLANRFNLSVNELKRMNNLISNVIRVGQRLRVNGSETSNITNGASFYVVKNGDNLYRIALNNGTTVNEIKRLNGLTSNLITVGQELQLR
ncbi:LysM peptidoglycan-binding domain-containing protein [uncultured Winogradskyella sp.]|uniref:LysM peptidoglycan-binding domain-containing protein n=1 Tax=uncultured Winogradskyella sp. TaxID=395353 RepID=UPI002634CB9B|nr:LysM peptidoglycan-binding domain-containing protein [uncultured Winogradskyella sp.]